MYMKHFLRFVQIQGAFSFVFLLFPNVFCMCIVQEHFSGCIIDMSSYWHFQLSKTAMDFCPVACLDGNRLSFLALSFVN